MASERTNAPASRNSQQIDSTPERITTARRSPLPSAGELDAEIERKLHQWDATRASGNGGGR